METIDRVLFSDIFTSEIDFNLNVLIMIRKETNRKCQVKINFNNGMMATRTKKNNTRINNIRCSGKSEWNKHNECEQIQYEYCIDI